MTSAELAEITAQLDARYVMKEDCSSRHERTEAEIKDISINQAKMQTTLGTITKIDIIILTAVVGLLAAAIGGVIFK